MTAIRTGGIAMHPCICRPRLIRSPRVLSDVAATNVMLIMGSKGCENS